MTIPDLITLVLGSIRNQFYADKPVRDYVRDERALMKAIARYGYACNERNWQFDAQFILRELMKLLQDIKKHQADIRYLPIYLEKAVDKHIGQRAEELSAEAKTRVNGQFRRAEHAEKAAQKAIDGMKFVPDLQKQTDTEVLAAVYADLNKRRRRKAVAIKPAAPLELFKI